MYASLQHTQLQNYNQSIHWSLYTALGHVNGLIMLLEVVWVGVEQLVIKGPAK